MAIKRADIYEHNNPNLAIVDSDNISGGIRGGVATIDDLYAFSGMTGIPADPEINFDGVAGQMKERSTVVYVSGETAYFVLKDINNITNSDGWEIFLSDNSYGTITGSTNGIIDNGTTVGLGGSLTGDTTINATGNSLTISNVGEFQVNSENTLLGIDDDGMVLSFSGKSVVLDNTGWLKYGDDYSSGFTANSIPDVNFVTGHTGIFLKVNQTNPQEIIDGQPIFGEGIVFGNTPSLISGHTKGRMYYDEDYQTISVDVGNESSLQLGQEVVRYVFNDTGEIIPNGSVVRDTGVYSSGDVSTTTIGLSLGDNIMNANVIGITTQEIGINEYGFVACRGNVNGINTNIDSQYSGFTVGDILYLSPTVYGGVTNVAPTSPDLHIKVGRLLKKDNVNGKIFVEIASSFSLNDLVDVDVPVPILDNVLKWNGTEWVNGVVGTISAGSGVYVFYSTPIINSVISPAGLSEDGSDGNGIQVATLANEPVTSGGTQVIASLSESDLRAFSAWSAPETIGRDKVDSGLWEFYDYLSVNATVGDTHLIHQINQIVDITGIITTTGAGANSRTATITTNEFVGDYFNASSSNLIASYLQTPTGIYQITSTGSTDTVIITVPTGYVNEVGVTGSIWNPLFSGSSETIENTFTTLYQTKATAPSFVVDSDDRLGEILYISATNSVELTLSYNGSGEASYVKTSLITSHNDLSGLQGGNLSERYHLSDAQLTVVNNTSNVNTGDETKSTIESKLTGEITSHNHPYSGLTGLPDLDVYQSESGFTSYTATTQPILDDAFTGATNNGVGVTIYSGETNNNLQFNTVIGSGGTTIQKVGDEIVINSDTTTASQQYSGESPSAIDLGGIDAGYVLTGKTVSTIIQDLLVPELFGTITTPTATVSLGYSGTYEIGTVVNQTVTATYNQGCISPQYSSVSDKRNPSVNAYYFTGDGMTSMWESCTSLSASQSASNYVVDSGNQTWSVCSRYDSGTTALSSKGNEYGDEPVSGCTNSPTGTITGILPWYWGTKSDGTISSADIAAGTKTVGNVSNSTPITYNATAEYLWFAAPSCASDKTKWWVCAANAGNIGGAGDLWAAPCSVAVTSADGCWNGCNFDVYVTCGVTTTGSGIPMCLYV